jgi:HD-like signal output (HDOD) protein
MIRGLLFVLLIAAVLAAVWSMMRDRRRGRSWIQRSSEPRPRQLPASTSTDKDVLSAEDVFGKFYELAFGAVRLTSSGAPQHSQVAAATHAGLDAMGTDSRYLPRRPMLLPELMRAVNDNESSRAELAQIIARDPALAGSLLKLANSSFYRIGPQPVESIERAVTLLGTDGIRSLMATAVMQPVFRVTGGSFAQFPDIVWEQTFRSAAAAEVHAATVENADPFAAQLLGLVMGLGTIMVFRATLDQYKTYPQVNPNAATIVALLEARAPDVARRIAENWGLSERSLAALQEQTLQPLTGEPSPLGRSLRFGRLVGALAVLHAHDRVDGVAAKASLSGNGASHDQIERIWARLAGDAVAA